MITFHNWSLRFSFFGLGRKYMITFRKYLRDESLVKWIKIIILNELKMERAHNKQ